MWLSFPDDPTVVEATSAAGALVTYPLAAAAFDRREAIVTCEPASGLVFALGKTEVTCTALDPKRKDSDDRRFDVIVRDTTPPLISGVPKSMTVEATAAKTPVSYASPTAKDLVSGSVAVSCSPRSGEVFAVGAATVTCTARDEAGNAASASFGITVVDKTAPVFAGAKSITREADGPAGSVVEYAKPTAVDAVGGAIAAVSCTPASGKVFPLGRTTVTCSAADADGNTAKTQFEVRVVDTTAPVLSVPQPITVSARGAPSVPASNPAVEAFLASATAVDTVDGKVAVRRKAPETFPVGRTSVEFSASDRAGNRAEREVSITVVAEERSEPKISDTSPPGNVSELRLTTGDRIVALRWRRPAAPDFDHVEVVRTDPKPGGVEKVVFRGARERFTDRGLRNGRPYRYLVVSYDQVGNRSAGVAIIGTPKARLLLAPADGAILRSPSAVDFSWRPYRDARYYNVQLYRDGRKILSAWPVSPHLVLRDGWTFAGRRQRLAPGSYRWFVWPGLGAQRDRRYGPVLGSGTFTVRR